MVLNLGANKTMSLRHKLEKSIARARKARKCAYAGKEGAVCDPDRGEDLEIIYREGGCLGFIYFCTAHRNHAFTMAAEFEQSPTKKLMAFGKHFEDDPRENKGGVE